MRSTGSGPLGALLMLAPLIAVPILAVVGIPQFAPGNLLDPHSSSSASSTRERRVPNESRLGDDARHDADDLFAPLEDSSDLNADFDDPLKRRKPGRRTGRSRDVDEFGQDENAPEFGDSEPSDDLDEGIAGTDSDSLDSRSELDSDDSLLAPAAGGRRGLGDRSPGYKNEPEGERFADSSGSSSSTRRGPQQSDVDNPFDESSQIKPSRPGAKRGSAAPAPRDPNDAPFYVPEKRARQDLDEPEAEAPMAPTSPKSPSGRKTAPRNPPVDPPEETPEQTIPAEPDAVTEPTEDLTWQTATKRLRAMGVGKSKQHFTYIEDRNVFLFTCTAIRLNDATKTRRFEAEADEPLLAVREVLQELEAWQASGTKPVTRPRTTVAGRD